MTNYIKLLLTCMLLIQQSTMRGQAFDDFFKGQTLRIDYTFTGNATQTAIAVDQLNVLPHWYGKHRKLSLLPVEGNGQITVKDHRTGIVIYRNSFSTLFQEWQSYDEAKTITKSFEHVALMPMPRDTADVVIELRNNRREVVASLTHQVVPTDILIRRIGFTEVTPYETIVQPKDTGNCIHIAFIAEGYKATEMSTFLKDAADATDAIFAHEPFKSMKDRFQVVAVKSPSRESGTSEPGKGIWKNTALHSHFDTFYSKRYLTTLHLKEIHDWLAGTPYEHIIVLVNSERYGGGGILNSYNLSTAHNRLSRPVIVHEFGHSFAGLADEYAYDFEVIPLYPYDIEPWEPNITTLADFHHKWEDLLAKDVQIPTPETSKNKSRVGVYEGAGYSTKGVYRPMMNCRMRTNENPDFCPVCQRAIKRLINFYTE